VTRRALILAVLVLLVSAAPATAETRTGEATSPVNASIPGEADILGATASYNSDAGTMIFTLRSREEPQPGSEFVTIAALGRPKEGACSYTTGQITYPVSYIFAARKPETEFGVSAFWKTIDEFSEEPVTEAEPASNVLSGATSTLVAASSELAGLPYTCAVIAIAQYGPESPKPVAVDEISFPISGPPAPLPSPTPETKSQTTTNASSGTLSVPKRQTVKLKREKWTKVQLKISNPGSGPTGPIALKSLAPRGVVLRFGTGKLAVPALGAGETWTVSYWVRATEKAKPMSTVSLTATTEAGLAAMSDLDIRATR
jgi:hypothetical protein